MFIALRDLRRTWRRFLLIGVVVALVAMLSTVLTALTNGLVQSGTSGLAALPLNYLAFQPGSQATFSRSVLAHGALEQWERVPGVAASPIGVSFITATPVRSGTGVDVALFGIEPGSFLAQRHDARAALSGSPGLVLASSLRSQGVRVGERFELGGSGVVLPVVGFTFGGSYGHAPIAYTSLSTWQSITYGNDARGRYSALALRVPAGVDVATVDRTAGTETMTKAQSYAGSPGYSAETGTMTLIRGFLLVISALIIGAFFTVLILQRRRQIGLLKAMGASNAFVLLDGLGQILIVVVIATVAGTGVGAAITALLQGGSAPVVFSTSGTLTAAGLLVLTAFVGSLVPFRRISNIEPAVALGAEA